MRQTYLKKLAVALIAVMPLVSMAQVVKPFTQRTSATTPSRKIYNLKGDFQMIGNSNLTKSNGGNPVVFRFYYWTTYYWTNYGWTPDYHGSVTVQVGSGIPTDITGSVTYTNDETGNVTALELITYLNERTKAGASIEISIPYIDGGILPPPEFGDEVYKLQMPAKIERNNWYTYEVKI